VHVKEVLRGPLPEGGEEVLVHLDLHGGNALKAGDHWKVIDPKGVRADRHADVWALIDPVALESLPEDAGAARATAERWIERYADAAEMDPGRAMDGTRFRARVEAGAADDAAWAAALNRMADALG
jgi:streptomycin 6-kinase